MLSRIVGLFVAIIVFVTQNVSAFAPLAPSIKVHQHQQLHTTLGKPAWKSPPDVVSRSSHLSVIPLSSMSGTARKLLSIPFLARKLIVLFSTVVLALNIRKIVNPNSIIKGDPTVSNPLPVKSSSCPMIGNNVLVGSRNFGPGYFLHKMSKILGHPRMWVFSFMGQNGVVMSGGKRVKAMLNQEFTPTGVRTNPMPSGILTSDNLFSQGNKKQHSAIRRLVGAAMTPTAVTASMPALQSSAEKQIQRMVRETELLRQNSNMDDNEAVHVMENICQDYTLDVAWKQILGLDLKDEEIPTFSKAVDTWVLGFTSPRISLNIFPQSTAPFKAKKYLTDLIMQKINSLEKNGPDDSTISGMLFARDEEDGGNKSKLTREEVVENALVLILAGSETSASTLTNAMLCLGLHSKSWEKLVEEQQAVVTKYGDKDGKVDFTTKMLDKECPYLDAVVREVMRIKPIPSGGPRFTKETMIVDGEQIPKGFWINWSVLLTHELDPVTYKEDGSHMDVRTGFVPERWLDEKTKPTTEFIPMGAGPRHCLGATLAYAEMKIFLAILAQNIAKFDLIGDNKKVQQEVKWKRFSIIPKPLDGVPISITMKEKNATTCKRK